MIRSNGAKTIRSRAKELAERASDDEALADRLAEATAAATELSRVAIAAVNEAWTKQRQPEWRAGDLGPLDRDPGWDIRPLTTPENMLARYVVKTTTIGGVSLPWPSASVCHLGLHPHYWRTWPSLPVMVIAIVMYVGCRWPDDACFVIIECIHRYLSRFILE